LCLSEDRYIRVGIFPKRKEILIGGARLNFVAPQGIGSREAKMSESTQRTIQDEAGRIENFLKLLDGFVTPVHREIGLSAYESRIEKSANFNLRVGVT